MKSPLQENCQAFEDVKFRPRQAVAVPQLDLWTKILGAELSFPAILAPIGYSRMIHPDGECAAARGAGAAGLAYILSTISGHKLEDVKGASSGPVWYQLYLLVGGRARPRKPRPRSRWSRGIFGPGRNSGHGDGGNARARRPKRHRATYER